MKRKGGEANQDVITKKLKLQRKWTEKEEKNILKYFRNTLLQNRKIEKPSAVRYYRQMIKDIKLYACSVVQLRCKVKNMRREYKRMLKWRSQVDQIIKDDAEKFKEMTLKRCKYFIEFDEIFGPLVSSLEPIIEIIVDSAISEDNKVEDIIEEYVDDNLNMQFNNWMDAIREQHDFLSTSPSSVVSLRVKEIPSRDRHSKSVFEMHRLDMELQRFEWEKAKWNAKMELGNVQLELEKQKFLSQSEMAKYDIYLKYQTQFQIAELQISTSANDNCNDS